MNISIHSTILNQSLYCSNMEYLKTEIVWERVIVVLDVKIFYNWQLLMLCAKKY